MDHRRGGDQLALSNVVAHENAAQRITEFLELPSAAALAWTQRGVHYSISFEMELLADEDPELVDKICALLHPTEWKDFPTLMAKLGIQTTWENLKETIETLATVGMMSFHPESGNLMRLGPEIVPDLLREGGNVAVMRNDPGH